METVAIFGLSISFILIALILSGVWIGAALGILGVIAFFVYGGLEAVPAIGHITFNVLTSYDLVAMPLFIFMATLLANCGVSERLYAGSAALFARLPGGLLHANVAGSALFATICGSVAATCAALSTVALPELEKRGYPWRVSLGSLAASGTIGSLIPPSIGFIVYAALTDTSVGQLFMGGIFPGIILTALFMAYIAVRSLIKKDIKSEKAGLRETLLKLLSIWPVAALFVLVMGSIYLGVCTAVEAGALGCSGSIVIAVLYRQFTRKNVRLALTQGVSITVLIFFVLWGGILLGHGLSNFGVPQYLVRLVVAMELSRVAFLVVLTVFYLILGCFLEGAAILAVTVPIIFPVVTVMGMDPIWFGVVMIIFTNMAALTPPVGVNLFVLQGITKKPLEEIFVGCIPFLILILVLEAILVAWPEIVLFLPSRMF